MAPKAATTTAAAPKAKAAAPEHASYHNMIVDAIVNLKERNGSSRVALKKYVRAQNKITCTDTMFDTRFNKALRTGNEKGVFAFPKGSSGTIKLAKKLPAPPKEKKAAAPKEKKAAAPKKTAASTDKKPAAKKVTKKAATTEDKPKAAAKPKAEKKTAAPKEKKAAAAKPKKAAATKTDAPAIVAPKTTMNKTSSGRVTKTKTDGAKPKTKTAAPKKKATPKKAAAAATASA